MSICPQCSNTSCAHANGFVKHCVEFRNKDFPTTRGTTAGELARMHVESENPDHYKTGGIECIDALRDALGHEGFIAYCRGQIIRYAWRIGKKDACLVEALKLEKYANWMVDEFNGKELRK